MEEQGIEIKNSLLQVYSEISDKSGKPVINWEYGSSTNAYFLIGVLEDIKKELLEHIDHESMEQEGIEE